jgi:hypothetical protein
MESLKLVAKQFARTLERQPGWVPVLVVVYIITERFPESTVILGLPMKDHRQAIGIIITFLFYQFGDAIDRAIFTRYVSKYLDREFPKFVLRPRETARHILSVQAGVYEISKELANASKRYEGTLVQTINELAKFCRSAALLVCLLPLIFESKNSSFWIACLIVGFLLFALYLGLKPLHMRILYAQVAAITGDSEYTSHDLPEGIRLHFYEGKLVSAHTIQESSTKLPFRS